MAAASYRAWGLVFALGGVVGFSFRPILVKLCYAAYPASPVTLLFLRMSLSLPVFMLVAWLLSRQDAGTPNDRLFVFGVLLCFANALSYAVYLVAGAELTQRIGANQFALIGGVSPVVTVFAAAFGLEEPVTILQVAGSVLVISGVLLVSLKQTS